MIELFLFITGASVFIVAINVWWNYVTDEHRLLGFIGRWLAKYYRGKTDDYPKWLMPLGCMVCRTWWSSVVVAIWFYEYPYIYVMPFIAHLLIRFVIKELYK